MLEAALRRMKVMGDGDQDRECRLVAYSCFCASTKSPLALSRRLRQGYWKAPFQLPNFALHNIATARI